MGKILDKLLHGEAKLLEKGREALRNSQYQEALQFAERALALDPKSKDARYFKGRVYLRQGKANMAIGIFDDLANTYHNDRSILEGAGDAYALGNQYQPAANFYGKVLALMPQSQKDVYAMRILKKRGAALIKLAKQQARSKSGEADKIRKTAYDCLNTVIKMQPVYENETQQKIGAALQEECASLLKELTSPPKAPYGRNQTQRYGKR